MAAPTDLGTEPIEEGMVLPRGYISTTEKTFQYQDSLPSLPVPPLSDTLHRYLRSIEPHVTNEEYQRTQRIVQQFENGIGRDLQQKLQQKAKTSRNWIESWWEDYAYLYNREPHIPFVNFAGPGPYVQSYWPPEEGSQCKRGGMVLWFAVKFWELLRQERLAVDRGGRTTIWCMDQFRKIFNGCKTPGHQLDKLNVNFKTEREGPCASHVVVICKGRFFFVNTFHPDGKRLTAPELTAQFEDVQAQCEHLGQGSELGALTAEKRTTWAQLRDHLIALHPDNRRYLSDIETCLLVIVLDDRRPVTMQELAEEGLIGDPVNRWYDKPVQYVFYKNGTMTSNGDHAPTEAMATLNINYFGYYALDVNGPVWKGSNIIRPMEKPREMRFHVDSVIERGVQEAKELFATTGTSVKIHTDHFYDYGKTFIRKLKLHPDTFMQMAIQLAYFRLYNRPAPTYETASARKFYHGRTETVRSCTNETVAWTKAMLDQNTQPKRKLTLLMAAMENHLKLMKEATEMEGCDRHLFGLQMTAAEAGLPVPDIFQDPAYTKSGGGGNYILSTSFIGFTPCFGGVAPMCKNGYGVFYSIMNERINVFVTTWRADTTTNGQDMYSNIALSLREIKDIIESSNNKL